MKIHVMHGIRSDGSRGIDKLIPALNALGYRTSGIDYEYVGLWKYISIRKRLWGRVREAAQQVLSLSHDGDVLVVHSHGGLVAWDTCRLGRKWEAVIMIAPSLDRDRFFHPDSPNRILLMTNPHDKALKKTRFLLFHPSGRMGMSGPEYPEKRMTVIQRPIPHGNTHGFWFEKECLETTAKAIDRFLVPANGSDLECCKKTQRIDVFSDD